MVKKKRSVIERTISFLEKTRFNFLSLFIWIFILSATRMWTEAVLFGYSYATIDYSHIFVYTHLIIFGYTTGFGALLILKTLTNEKLVKIVNLAALGGIIVLIPHLLDFFIFNRTDFYRYLTIEGGLEAFTSLYVGGIGLFIEGALMMILTSLYVYIKTKSIIKSILNFFAFFVLVLFLITPTLNPLIAMWKTGGQLLQPILVLYFLIIGIILLYLLLRVSNKNFISNLWKNLKPYSLFLFLIATLLGVVVGGHLNINLLNLAYPLHAGNIGTFGISLFAVFFSWLSFNIYNKVVKSNTGKTDDNNLSLLKSYISPRQGKEIVIILAVISTVLASTLNANIVILTVTLLFILLSISHLEGIKRNIFQTIFIGVGSAVAFFIGYFTPSYTIENNVLPFVYGKTTPEITIGAIVVGAVIFVIFSIASIFINKSKNRI